MGDGSQVDNELSVTFLLREYQGEWIGLCLEFDIVASGDTKEEVVDVLKDLVDLYVAGNIQLGNVPVPLRPAPPEVLAEFMAPTPETPEVPLTAHRESVVTNAAA